MRYSLLITSAGDLTGDLFARRFSGLVARVDADAGQIPVVLSESGIEVAGIRFERLDSVYWRKPFLPHHQAVQDLAYYESQQRKYVLKSLCALARRRGVWMLVDPDYESTSPRAVQLVEAMGFFSVPPWVIAPGDSVELSRPRVVKSLVPTQVKDGRFMSTQRIPPGARLSPEFTWYVQDSVDAPYDITVVFCCGKMWAFQLDRRKLGTEVDWRLFGDNHRSSSWQRVDLPNHESAAILGYMSALGLHFGRLDFLRDHEGRFWFLEVNPNGQFGWLDADRSLGMQDWIFDCALAPPAGWSGSKTPCVPRN